MNATSAQYAAAWYELLAASPKREWKGITSHFLKTLHSRGELGLLPEIIRATEEKEALETGIAPVTVTAARAIDPETVKKIVAAITGEKKPAITQIVDAEVLGGIRIETKNRRWNLSVSGALGQLRKQLQ